MSANFECLVKEVGDYKELKENIKKANDLLKEIGKKIKEIEKLGCTVHSVYESDDDNMDMAIHSEDDLFLM